MMSTLAMELAIIPGIIIFIYVWRMDRIEKEPAGLLWSLFFLGGLTILSAMLIGQIGEAVVSSVLTEGSMLYLIIDNFLLTALIEEGGKYIVLRARTWKHPAFNFTFDGVVYAVVVSLGFATFENILYVGMFGIGTAVLRALTAVPSHAMDAVFMGCYYGYAKMAFAWGDQKNYKRFMKLALIVPVLLHGFYDFCLSTENYVFIGIFWIFYITVTVITFRKLKMLSQTDARIY